MKLIYLYSGLLFSMLLLSREATDFNYRFADNGRMYYQTVAGNQDRFDVQIAYDAMNAIVMTSIENIDDLDAISIIKFTELGVIDTSFGTEGKVILTIGRDPEVHGIAIQPNDNSISIVGAITLESYRYAFLMNINQDGSMNANFGNEGIVIIPSEQFAVARALLVNAETETIFVAGDSGINGFIASYYFDGTTNTKFGSLVEDNQRNGILFFNDPFLHASFVKITIDEDNKILGIINLFNPVNNEESMQVIRYQNNGTVEKIFEQLLPQGATRVLGKDITVQPYNDNVLVTGIIDNAIFTAQWKPNGQLDTYFGDRVAAGQPLRRAYTLFTPENADSVNAYQIVSELDERISVFASYTQDERQHPLWFHYTRYGILDNSFGEQNEENISQKLGYFIIEQQGESLQLLTMKIKPGNQNNIIAGLSINDDTEDEFFIMFDYLGLQATIEYNKGQNGIKNKKNVYGQNPRFLSDYLQIDSMTTQFSSIDLQNWLQQQIGLEITLFISNLEGVESTNYIMNANLLLSPLAKIERQAISQYPSLANQIRIFFLQLRHKIKRLAQQ